jgi:hypothetical protein
MKGFSILRGDDLQIYLLTIKTNQLNPISLPIINSRYAVYNSPSFTVQKISMLNINGNIDVQFIRINNLTIKVGNTLHLHISIYRSLNVLKKHFGVAADDVVKKKYYNNGMVEKIFFNKDKLFKTIYQIGNTRVKHLHQINLTKYINEKKQVVATFPFIVTHYKENNTCLSLIESIKYSIRDDLRKFIKNRKFTKNFTKTGNVYRVCSKDLCINSKKHGVSFNNWEGICVWRRGVLISHSITDILKEIEYLINRKKAVVLF